MKIKQRLCLVHPFRQRIFAQGVSFIVSLVLARMLLPEEYGIVALVLVFINLANVFVTNGLGETLIQQLHDWLVLEHTDSAIAMAGFILKNTLSENGGVTRGVCKIEDGHAHIIDVVETSNIIMTETGAEADGVKLDPEAYVSMNMWGFPAREGCAPAYLIVLEDSFKEFFAKDVKENPLMAEYLLPTHIGGLLRADKCSVKVLETKDKWFGVTYKEDKELVVNSFKKLIADGIYKENLYSDL